MTNEEAVNWLINLTADMGKSENRNLWHYEQALSEIKEMLEGKDTNIPSNDTISRQAAIDAIESCEPGEERFMITSLPSAQPEPKRGRWIEKHHAYSDEESVIEEWQSCCCSECGRYDTRPYMYYFSEPNYCSYCGADMRGEHNG